ncbi:hypothetical protein [Oceanibacterium hippocampi]|uniref:Terminase small subunit protein n=1 Tax=Oceanibacterium hippocampi TaxID=745714 RepID=A0A1Y5S3M2_9PROT|nr:hypothetical protein [Oceanibacterium hippocampi]SLN31941.1 hypothetical protein OCH7691_01162 [Oceanibacterium hippocampi]
MTDRPTRRPSGRYNGRLALEICARLADGISLRRIAADPAMPARSTIWRWLAEKPEFAAAYRRARAADAERLADEILEIADDGGDDYVLGAKGGALPNTEHLQRSKLRIDTRKWLIARRSADATQAQGDANDDDRGGAGDAGVTLYLPDNERD